MHTHSHINVCVWAYILIYVYGLSIYTHTHIYIYIYIYIYITLHTLHYVWWMSIDQKKENGFSKKKARRRWYPIETDVDYTDERTFLMA